MASIWPGLRRRLVSAIACLAPELAYAQFIQPAQPLAVEPFGAEDPHAEYDVPRVPEPMCSTSCARIDAASW